MSKENILPPTLPLGVKASEQIKDMDIVNTPCPDCGGRGVIKGIVGFLDKQCEPCKGRGYTTEMFKLIFLAGLIFREANLHQVYKGMQIWLDNNPDKKECHFAIQENVPGSKPKKYPVRRGHVQEDIGKLIQPWRVLK